MLHEAVQHEGDGADGSKPVIGTVMREGYRLGDQVLRHALVGVVDTVVGFSPTEKERLFARFQQADGSITRRFGGSGLGLAVSHGIVRDHDGWIEIDSRPGTGTTFQVFLPAEAPALERGESAA